MTNDKPGITQSDHSSRTLAEPAWRLLVEFTLPGGLNSEREVLEKVSEAVRVVNLPAAYLDQLKMAATRATLNAIKQGHRSGFDTPIVIRVLVSDKSLSGSIADQQSLQSWGFFLIGKMINDNQVSGDEAHHTIELFLYLEGG